MNSSPESDLEHTIRASFDALVRALTLAPYDGDRFEAVGEPGRFDRVFGGQLIAQALLAASATVDGKLPHSLHAYFVKVGTPGEPVELSVDRVRDGRSISTREVRLTQGDRDVLVLIASFHAGPDHPQSPAAPAPNPEDLPRLQDWVQHLPPETRQDAHRMWVEHAPPLDLRIAEPPSFLGGPTADGTRSHWMRLPAPILDDPIMHAALLAYASDYLLLDMAFRARPSEGPHLDYAGFSLDHSIWFHRPIRFDGWLLHTQEAIDVTGDRGLIRGSIHDRSGQLVASVMQEVLIRSVNPDPSTAGQ